MRKNLKSATERQKRDYDSRIVENVYQRGDIVYKREGAGKKLGPKYAGPFIVIECLSPSHYKIQGKRVTLVVHQGRLQKYETVKLPA